MIITILLFCDSVYIFPILLSGEGAKTFQFFLTHGSMEAFGVKNHWIFGNLQGKTVDYRVFLEDNGQYREFSEYIAVIQGVLR